MFVIVGHTPGGDLVIPVGSARIAAQVARHLTEHCPHTQASWQVSTQAEAGQLVVWGYARPPAGEHLLDQEVHAFLLAAGDAPPPVWVALCRQELGAAEFEVLDAGVGRPCPACRQRLPHQDTGLPVRAPGQHMHPRLRSRSADHCGEERRPDPQPGPG